MVSCKICKKQAYFNFENLKPIYCAEHRKDDMINLINKSCIMIDCLKQPSYNFINTITPIYCLDHKRDGMVDIKNKTCLNDTCTKRPNYNIIGSKIGIYCLAHATKEMIDVMNKRCIEKGCGLRPTYAGKGTITALYCSHHRKENMVDIRHKTCIELGCNKRPTFNIPSSHSLLYCKAHKKENMVDVGNKICIEPYCNTRAMVKSKYCTTCLRFYFPLLDRWKNIKQKEVYLVKEIQKSFPDLSFVFDKIVDCQSCSKRRPDIFLDLGYYSIIIEIDEHQHSRYSISCENKRMMEIFESLGNRPVVFIRFNPDRYNNTKGIFTFSKGGIIKPNKFFNDRYNKLVEIIQYYLDFKPTKDVEKIILYFDDINIPPSE
jgi:hypothetical protein